MKTIKLELLSGSYPVTLNINSKLSTDISHLSERTKLHDYIAEYVNSSVNNSLISTLPLNYFWYIAFI